MSIFLRLGILIQLADWNPKTKPFAHVQTSLIAFRQNLAAKNALKSFKIMAKQAGVKWLLKKTDGFLLDIYGVLYNQGVKGPQAIEGSVNAIKRYTYF